MNKTKFIVLLILLLLIALSILNINLLRYGAMQAKGQLGVIWNARPIEEALQDRNFPDSLKSKIRLMQEIREFAIDSLGLSDSENYTTIFDQKGKDILWNISASERFKLKSVQWDFPFLGKFSYKGFFDLTKAKEERDELKAQGYDTRIRPVNAWSTLGWFKDPILTNQLYRGDGSLAELVIHELTHATIFIKDSLSFNENLASFIGEKGAIKFLTYKYGTESVELDNYMNSEGDYIKYTDHMLHATNCLDSLYNSFINETGDSIKLRLKTELISKIVNHVDTITFDNPKRFKNIFSNQLPNNTYFLSFTRYFSKIDLLENILETEFDNNLNALINYYRENQ